MNMKTLSKALRSVVAKSDRENGSGWLPFWMHSMDAAGIMERLIDNWIPKSTYDYLCAACGGAEWLIPVLIFCAIVHDLGKITLLFQSRIGEAVQFSPFSEFCELPRSRTFGDADKTSHALASEAILRKYECPCGIASIAGGHHGKPIPISCEIDFQIEDYPQNFYGKGNKKLFESLWSEWIDFALEYSGFESIDELPDIPMPAQVIICGMLIMADWIASNTYYFPLIAENEYGAPEEYPERVDRAWKKISFPMPWVSNARLGLDNEDFSSRFGFSPNPTQRDVIEAVNDAGPSGIYILEAPMGLGKTEAALAISEILAARSGAGGLFFGMPTQATSNGIFPRLENWAKELSADDGTLHSIRLAHAAAALNDDYRGILEGHSDLNDEGEGKLIVHDWFSGRKQALLSDFVIGTVDQMLMAALKQKHVMLRHLGLIGKVVVIDECHAYDAYMSQYLDMAVKWLGVYKVPVVILSATLPEKRRAELVEAYLNVKSDDAEWKHSLSYPLLTYTEDGKIKQKALTFDGDKKLINVSRIQIEEMKEKVAFATERGGCVGVIVNTVRKAQEIAAELRSDFPDCEVIVMHAQFIMTERADREKLILNRVGKNSKPEDRRRLIIVGTQVLEQSLDLDFDLMITELCPMDLLLQRTGRLHRHKRKRPEGLEDARCYVIDTMDENFDEGSKAIYGEWLLMRTRALLPEKLTIPDDIPPLVQRTYDINDLSMLNVSERTEKAREEYEKKITKKERGAGNYLIGDPPEFDNMLWMNTLDGWLDNNIKIGEQYGEMAVRDGDPSIDVIALKRGADGKIHLITKDEVVPTDRVPSRDESLAIARQKLRLPGYFSKKWNIEGVINELENSTKNTFPDWQESPLLKEELALIFDADLNAELCGTKLHYDIENGLTYEKE